MLTEGAEIRALAETQGLRPELRCANPQQWTVSVGDVVQVFFDMSG